MGLREYGSNVANALRGAQKNFDASLERLGILSLNQQDLAIRLQQLSWVNDRLTNPLIEINDRVNIANRAFGEVGATWAATGGNPMFSQMAAYEKVICNTWLYIYSSIKPMYPYFTAVVELEEEKLIPAMKDGMATSETSWTKRTVEIDGETLLHYQKTIPEKVSVLEIIEHEAIEPEHQYVSWTKRQMKENLDVFGMAEVISYIEFGMWHSFLPEHINARTPIVIHGVQNEDRRRGPPEREDEMELTEAAKRFKEKHKDGQV